MGWGFEDDDGPSNPHALREAENGIRQGRRVIALIREALVEPASFRLTPSTVCELNQYAVDGVSPTAGRLRERSDVEIAGSSHVLPPHDQVASLLDEACDFVAAHRSDEPLFLAAYTLWRICWIHPFDDGNGRTARAAAYLVLSVAFGFELSGSSPIPARIKHAPLAYVRALEAADAAWSAGRLDVSAMQDLLAFYLQAQLDDAPISLPP